MKHILLFEQYININPTILDIFKDLPNLQLNTNLPQVGSKRIQFTIFKNTIISDYIINGKLYDYVITENCELLIGFQHYRMCKKSENIKCSGEIKINNEGKICYINNESGHYKPSKKLLKEVSLRFKLLNLLSKDAQIDYLY